MILEFGLVPVPLYITGILLIIALISLFLTHTKNKALKEVVDLYKEQLEVTKARVPKLSKEITQDWVREVREDNQRRVYYSLQADQSLLKSTIRTFMDKNAINQTQLGIKAGTSNMHISRILSEDKDLFHTHTGDLQRILNVLGLTLVVVRRMEPKWTDIKTLKNEKG